MSGKIDERRMQDNRGYAARGVVSKACPIGYYTLEGGVIQTPVYKYMTFDTGGASQSFAAEYVGLARMTHDGYLDFSDLEEGEIVVNPAFKYKKIPWSTSLLEQHLTALKTYKRKDIVKSYVDPDEKPIDLGAVNTPKT